MSTITKEQMLAIGQSLAWQPAKPATARFSGLRVSKNFRRDGARKRRGNCDG